MKAALRPTTRTFKAQMLPFGYLKHAIMKIIALNSPMLVGIKNDGIAKYSLFISMHGTISYKLLSGKTMIFWKSTNPGLHDSHYNFLQ